MKTYLAGLLIITVFTSYSQQIEIYSIDSGGDASSNGGISIVYSMGEVTTVEGVVGDIAISSGFINKYVYAANLITSSVDYELKFLIHPNPSSEFIYIKTALKIDHMVLYDTQGQKVVEQSNDIDFLDIRTLKSGLYLLRIVCGEKTFSENILIY